jgi:hypothetical protein
MLKFLHIFEEQTPNNLLNRFAYFWRTNSKQSLKSLPTLTILDLLLMICVSDDICLQFGVEPANDFCLALFFHLSEDSVFEGLFTPKMR